MFEPGRVYRRDEMHRGWNGNTQLQREGGILTPREVPFVIVITGEEGRQYGYADFWDPDGVFHYYGAGQEGDMEFARGNLALRDHGVNGEEVHLFEQIQPSGLRYIGPMVSAGYYERDDVPDRNGDLRLAIIFELVAVDDEMTRPTPEDEPSPAVDSRWNMSMVDLRDRLAGTVGKQLEAKDAKRRIYARSDDLKIYVRRRADGVCEGCGAQAPFRTRAGQPYLEPHHTRRVADGGPDDYHHVIAVCPTCHRRVHHGRDGQAYNDQLRAKLTSLEP